MNEMTRAEITQAAAPNRTALVMTARNKARKKGLENPSERYTNAVAKKMSSDIVLKLNCLPGWYPRAKSTFTPTFITAQAASRTSTVPRASALVTVVTLFNTASTIRNSQRKLTATLSPTRRRSASNLASMARARTSCQRRESVRVSALDVKRLTHGARSSCRSPEIYERLKTAPSPLFEYMCCIQRAYRFE